MTKVQIKKNQKVIKTFSVPAGKNIQTVFNMAVDIAGGMWNGIDDFVVNIFNCKNVHP